MLAEIAEVELDALVFVGETGLPKEREGALSLDDRLGDVRAGDHADQVHVRIRKQLGVSARMVLEDVDAAPDRRLRQLRLADPTMAFRKLQKACGDDLRSGPVAGLEVSDDRLIQVEDLRVLALTQEDLLEPLLGVDDVAVRRRIHGMRERESFARRDLGGGDALGVPQVPHEREQVAECVGDRLELLAQIRDPGEGVCGAVDITRIDAVDR